LTAGAAGAEGAVVVGVAPVVDPAVGSADVVGSGSGAVVAEAEAEADGSAVPVAVVAEGDSLGDTVGVADGDEEADGVGAEGEPGDSVPGWATVVARASAAFRGSASGACRAP
jgi:hypothetical protein